MFSSPERTPAMVQRLQLMEECNKPLDQFMTFEFLKSSFTVKTVPVYFVESHSLIVCGIKKQFHRLYVRKKGNPFDGIGWVLTCDVTDCMICGSAFGSYLPSIHCSACGNLVCVDCSSFKAIVVEYSELEEQHVCNKCCSGQAIVTAVMRPNEDTQGGKPQDILGGSGGGANSIIPAPMMLTKETCRAAVDFANTQIRKDYYRHLQNDLPVNFTMPRWVAKKTKEKPVATAEAGLGNKEKETHKWNGQWTRYKTVDFEPLLALQGVPAFFRSLVAKIPVVHQYQMDPSDGVLHATEKGGQMLFEYTCILTQEHNVDVTIHKDVYNFTMWWEDEVLVQKRVHKSGLHQLFLKRMLQPDGELIVSIVHTTYATNSVVTAYAHFKRSSTTSGLSVPPTP